MFDFEKLEVYKKAKSFHSRIRDFLKTGKVDKVLYNQLNRSSLSIVLNIAEGSGRFSKPDRRNFFVISRSSIFEVIAILDILKDDHKLEGNLFEELYDEGEQLSKILFTMIRNLEKK